MTALGTRTLTDEDDETFRRMRDGGLAPKVIQRELGIGRDTYYRTCCRLGIPSRGHGTKPRDPVPQFMRCSCCGGRWHVDAPHPNCPQTEVA